MSTQPEPAPVASTGAAVATPERPYLDVRDLKVTFGTDDGEVRAVSGLSFSLERGRTLGIVGESGSGKSAGSLAIMGLQRGRRTTVSGEIWLAGENLVEATPERVRTLRGREMAMIFQDPLSAMHPYYTIGQQIVEAYRVHNDVSRRAARTRAIEMLDRVGIPDPVRRLGNYPHEFSGGMRQRAMIAMALSCDPSLLIADEPTTALDVTVQAQILDLLRDLQKEFGSAIVIITHDLGVVAEISDEVLVMYAGNAVEHGPVQEIFSAPQHPYTWGLLSSMTRLDRVRSDRLRAVQGNPPSLVAVPPGCPFHPRCQYSELAGEATRTVRPLLETVAPGHRVACHLAAETRVRIFRDEVAPNL
ncbi:ABC transporter ATP-binding protein [Frankia sp. AgB1.9]|uniref:ABC transporter ATP-binding protein n=1 Tax=unclassified Frankia TaxID=2632575 RepID=UPI001932FD43|nr:MULTISPECIES: ABC transporter ATP-binding protein [unclassified Frankia]MBL7486523.1 ABC transporter ATP-binding protein [Frankia sp. AgW1.1]MBL7550754.1 ABC transporter ATP-binding protein [Frankia sp. AgB1.9]MBL7622586.1 ABC transporter ATP-binding protein [Frankia sp. AgB1.8]